MGNEAHHAHLIKELSELFKPILASSPQAIYIYLDDEHKICNQKFAKLVGYKSIKQWIENPFPVSDVAKADQKAVIKAYYNASKKFKASAQKASIVTKSGKKIKVEVIMAPITYENEVFVIHFITKV